MMTERSDGPAADFLRKGMVVRSTLPSKAVLDRRLPEVFRNHRLGNRQIAQVTGYFRNKLGSLSTKFYKKLTESCIVIPVQENSHMYVVPPDKVLEVYDWVQEFKTEYVTYEQQLRAFIQDGEIPRGVKASAKCDAEYLDIVKEYLTQHGLDPRITVPDIVSRVDIRFEEFHMGDRLFQMFAEMKYEELTMNLSRKELEALEQLEREVATREKELMESARESVRKRVEEVLREINGLAEDIAEGSKGPTRRKLRTLRAALEAAERLASSTDVDADFSSARTVLESLSEEEGAYQEIKTIKRKKKDQQGALVEAVKGFAMA
jgi:hypothetical protein